MDITAKVEMWKAIKEGNGFSNSISDYPRFVQDYIHYMSEHSLTLFYYAMTINVIGAILMGLMVHCYYLNCNHSDRCRWARYNDEPSAPVVILFVVGAACLIIGVCMALANLDWYWISSDLYNYMVGALMK